jgi:hypothetical protein
MDAVQTWARRYRTMGLAVCRVQPGEKRPTYGGWNRHSLEPEDFREGDNIGLQTGPLSGNLVCVDIDHPDALGVTDRFLPPTSMMEGRPGKRSSHRWYIVKDVPNDLGPRDPHAAGGLGGPGTRRFHRPDGTTLIDLLGTGLQAVVPASVWTSRDGKLREPREWERLDGLTVKDCRELYDDVSRLARACGWQEKAEPRREKKAHSGRRAVGEAETLPMPTGEAARQARQFLTGVQPAVEGQGGNDQTFSAAAILVIEFGLTPQDALPVLLEWNRRCSPPWKVEDLKRKLANADALAHEREDRGSRVRKRNSSILINLLPDELVVYVGIDVKKESRSFVDLSPTFFAGMVRVGTGWELAPELAALPWEGKSVLLAPASTVSTNARESWADFFLARLLRNRGADVMSVRLPPLDGRRRTFSKVEDLDWEVVDPPRHAWEAAHAAEKASQEAKQVDAYRRALGRRKTSPKLDKAMEFVRASNVTALTKDVLRRAKRKGIAKDTLWKALRHTRPTPTT